MKKKHPIYQTFQHSIPVLLGYLPLGAAFGIMLSKQGYHFSLAPLMSLLIYAGSGQYLAVKFFSTNASFPEIGIATFLLNSRHSFFGLSLLDKFKNIPLKIKSYLIFALTDETYALLTSKKVPEGISKEHYYLYLSLFNHFYWITGSFIGALFGQYLKFNDKGMDFTLTALFVVLSIEQYYAKKKLSPFIIATIIGIPTLIFISEDKVLLVSISLSVLLLIAFRRKIK